MKKESVLSKRQRFSGQKLYSEEQKLNPQNESEISPQRGVGTRIQRRAKKLLSLPLNHLLVQEEVSYDISKDYELKDVIGVGTYSQVRDGISIYNGEEVAIKICRGDTSIELLKREMEIMKNLTCNFTPKIIDFKEDKVWKRAYLIMEKINGVTLDSFLENSPKLSNNEILNFIYQLCLIVKELHQNRICHRDIKPSNIIVTKDQKLRLIDFNISKTWDSGKTCKTEKKIFLTQISTPLFAAPEITLGKGYDESIDVWGIGIISYLLIGGNIDEAENRLCGEDKTQIVKAYLSYTEKCSNLSDQTKDFIRCCLEEDPSNRLRCCDPIFESMIEYCSEVINGESYEEFKSE